MKPGYQTTEFWLTVAGGVASVLHYFPRYAGVGGVISYILGRAAVKALTQGQ
jgi:hypothetical protein